MKTLENLDGMADLEAKLAFATNDKNEAQEELEFVRRSNSSQISELKNQVAELDEKYNVAHTAEVAVKMYEKKLVDFQSNEKQIKRLEMDNKQLRNQTDFLLNE